MRTTKILKSIENDRVAHYHKYLWSILRSSNNLGEMMLASGPGLRKREKLDRLLRLHKRGFNAECQMKAIQADLFWEQSYKGFEGIFHSWELSPHSENEKIVSDSIKEFLIKEIFVPTHI